MDKGTQWFRIKELERLSGMPRRTIHFYLQEGLLQAPLRTGKTMAYYDEGHLQRLKVIREGKEKGTPLFAMSGHADGVATPRTRSARHRSGGSPKDTDRAQTGTPPRRRAKGKETRESILAVGCRLFRQQGFKGTKVSDITKRLGIGKGTFYFYFSDKDELFLECVPRIFSELFGKGWDKIRKEKDPLKRLALRAQTVLPVLDEFCVIMALSREALQSSEPKLKMLGEQTLASIRRPLESDIEKGIREGVVRPVDPLMTSAMMIGIMEGLNALRASGKKLSPATLRDGVFSILISGIRAP